MATKHSEGSDEAQIKGLIEGRIKAIGEKDVAAVLSEYAPDVVMFNLAPPLQTKGTDREGIEKWFSGYQGVISYEIRDLNSATDGRNVDMWVRATLCFQKIAGEWLITHEHNSEPFDMRTLKALLDLKP